MLRLRTRQYFLDSDATTMAARRLWSGSAMVLALVATASRSKAQVVTDGGFEPGTVLRAFARAPGNPWVPGQWNAENATIITAPTSGISPRTGSGMLRMNQSCSVSQVNQIIALPVPPPANVTYSAYVNAPGVAVSVSLALGAGDGQNAVGQLTNETSQQADFVTDSNTATWERFPQWVSRASSAGGRAGRSEAASIGEVQFVVDGADVG
jgi:hypothetical protein